ncbi:MAG TPA: alpha-glucosidase [Dermatophilaceae bacterium]|nr:alpha-glucosidase [Dermatophilaceae bacterium]
MTEPKWFHRAVVYQIYPRSFADSDGDGIGDLRGALGKLDYLARLGVDVVWLSPVYPSPQDDNGYDISDYQDIDPTFGSLEVFGQLLDAAHERGIKVVMDLVVNHTSDEHAWFVESRSSKDSPKRDWYFWLPAREGFAAGEPGAEPTDWESYFSGPAWQLDETTGEYYLHLFSRKQPDLNWENPQVREAVYAMMRWWLDRGVDGFRMDVIDLISKSLPLKDGDTVGCGPRIHEFLHEMHEQVFAGRAGDYLTVGEMPTATIEDARLFTDPTRGEVDMVFQFEHVGLDQGHEGKFDIRPMSLVAFKDSLGRWDAGLAGVGWNSLYWNNHDQPRAVSRFGSDGEHRVASAKALGTLLHLHRGTPYVYQGEELGMTNAPFTTIEDFRDIESLNYHAVAIARGSDAESVLTGLRYMGRDNARTPVQWDDGPHAGFTTGTPWIPVNPNYVEINAAAQVDDPDSVFNHYRRLIAFRHEEPVVAEGDFTMLLPQDEQVYAFTRRHEGTELLVVANCSDERAEVPLVQDWADAEVVIASGGDSQRTIAFSPWEARVYRRVV